MPIQFADHDNDGRPDHVLGPDGLWRQFNPNTGDIIGGPPGGPAVTGGNSSTGVTPSGFGGGTSGRLPTPTPPLPAPPPGPVAPPPTMAPSVGSGMSAAPRPAYHNGQMHPAWGGAPRTPGGMSSSTAPSSGPADLRAQRGSPLSGADRAFNSSGRPYGGGGGGSTARDLIGRVRGEIMGKVGGMFGGSSSAPSYGGGAYRFPSFSSGGSSGTTFEEPPEPKMTGLAKDMDPTQASAILSRPSILLASLMGKSANPASPFYDTLESLPASSLALLGTSGKKSTPRTNTSQQVNAIGDVYTDAATGKLPSMDQMIQQLTATKPKSALGQLMAPPPPDPTFSGYRDNGQAQYRREETTFSPLPQAASTVSSLLSAMGAAGAMDERAISAMGDAGNFIIDQYAAGALGKKPSDSPMLTRKVGRRLF